MPNSEPTSQSEELNPQEIEGEFYDKEKEETKKIDIDDIMPFDEYIKKEEAEIEKGNENGIEFYPFELHGKGEYEGKYVSFVGVSHENDPDHEIFEEIKQRFNEATPDVVFVEGYRSLSENRDAEINFLKSIDYEQAIREHGESVFTAKLAVERGVPVESPEPPADKGIEYLLDQGFSKEHVFVYYFCKNLQQYMKIHSKEDRSLENFRSYTETMIEEFRYVTNWKDFSYSFDHAVDIYRAIWSEDLTLDDFNQRKIDPALRSEFEDEHTGINDIAAASSLFRDVYIANRIEQALKENNSVLVVYGSAHAVMQEPALRKVIEGEE